jgi:hypothetical protein
MLSSSAKVKLTPRKDYGQAEARAKTKAKIENKAKDKVKLR